MQQYLTISEFAALRGININSLRYYEKLKILTPAWVDPQTKYRYYLPEQLSILDTITLCIALGIPLKNLKEYIDADGSLDQKSILEKGRQEMQKKVAEMQLGLELTQFNLENMEQNQQFCEREGTYTREIEERFFLTAPFHGNWDDLRQKEKTAMELFHRAQRAGMAPVFPAGLLIHCETDPVSYSFFVQVLYPAKENRQILRIPKADFICMQVDITPQTDIPQVLAAHCPQQALKTVILSNMPLDKIHFNSRHSELQIPAFELADGG